MPDDCMGVELDGILDHHMSVEFSRVDVSDDCMSIDFVEIWMPDLSVAIEF